MKTISIFLLSLFTFLYGICAIPGTIQWSYLTKGWITASPIQVNNQIFFSSNDGNVYALSTSGSKLWSYRIGYEIQTSPIAIPVNNTLIVACTNSMVIALNTLTGTLLWSTNITLLTNSINPLVIFATPILSLDNTLLFITTATTVTDTLTNYVVALTTSGGTAVWLNTTSYAIYSTPTLSIDGTKLFFADDSSTLYSVNTGTGYLDWKVTVGARVYGPVTADTDQAFVSDNAGSIQAFFTFSGVEQWNSIVTTGVCYPTLYNPNNILYIGCSNNGSIYSLNVNNNGNYVWPTPWLTPTNAPLYSAPTIGITPGTSSNVTVYVGSSDTCLYALNDSQNGTLTWSVCTEGEIRSSPLLDPVNNVLYIGSLDGRIYSISTA